MRDFNVGQADTGSGTPKTKAEKEWEKRLNETGVSPSSSNSFQDSQKEWDKVRAANGLITDPDELINLGFDHPQNFVPQAGSPDAAGYGVPEPPKPVAPVNPITHEPIDLADFAPKPRATYTPISPEMVETALQQRKIELEDEYYANLDSQKRLDKSMHANFGTISSQLTEERMAIQDKYNNEDALREEVTRGLRAEQAARMIHDNPNDQTSWDEYFANTMDPQEFDHYQRDPLFAQLARAKAHQEIEAEATQREAIEDLEAKYGGELKWYQKGWEALKSWAVHDVPGTFHTVAGTIGADMAQAHTMQQASDPFLNLGLATGDRTFGEVTEQALDDAEAMIEDIEAAADIDLLKGAEYFQEAGLNRAAVTQGNLASEFIYDATKVLPDMAITLGLAAATGTGSLFAEGGAKLTFKEAMKGIMKKETQKQLLKALGTKMIVTPDKLPMGMRIFAQTYQQGVGAGMGEDQAYFTAFLNAYGQSVLEDLGVNELVKIKGAPAAVKVISSFFEEGFEEIPQNWWESAVMMSAGGQDMPIFEFKDKDAEALFNAPRDLYSFFVALPGGAMGATPSAIATGVDAYQTATKPKVELPGVGDTIAQAQEYADQEEAKSDAQKAKEASIPEDLRNIPEAYKDQTYGRTERQDALTQVWDDVMKIEMKVQTDIMEDPNSDLAYEIAFERAMDLEEDSKDTDGFSSLRYKLDEDELSEASMDLIYRQAYKNILEMPEPELAMDKAIKEAGYEAVQKPVYEPKVDTTKMHPVALQRMNKLTEGAPTQEIVDLAAEGLTASQIAEELDIKKTQARAVLTMKGIPRRGTPEFAQWVTGRAAAEGAFVKTSEQQTQQQRRLKADNVVQETIKDRGRVLTIEEARARLAKTSQSDADVKVNLTNGQQGIVSLGQKLGLDVIFFENSKRKNLRGFVNPGADRRTIFVNADGIKAGDEAMFVLGHEYLHALRNNDENTYQELFKYVGSTLTSDQISDYISMFDADTQQKLLNNRDLVIEEMLADGTGSMFADKSWWQKLYDSAPEAAKKLAASIREFIDMVLNMARKSPTRSNILTETQIEELRARVMEATSEIIKKGEIGKADAVTTIQLGTVQPKESVRSFAATDTDALIAQIVKSGFTQAQAEKYVSDMKSIAAIVLDNPNLQYDPNDQFSPVKPNSDPLYKYSLDFSTLCKKRAKMQATLDAIYKANGRILQKGDIVKVRSMLSDLGEEVACGLCYVDSARLKEAKPTNELLEGWVPGISRKLGMKSAEYKQALKDFMKGRRKKDLSKRQLKQYEAIKDSAEDYVTPEQIARIKAVDPNLLLTTEGREQMARQDFDIYKAAMGYISEKSHAKGTQPRSEYVPGMLQQTLSPKFVANVNRNAGMRWQSWSDFEFVHMLDAMQAIGDMAIMGLKGHMYTKVPEAVHALGKTGMMLNMSLIPKGDTGMAKGQLEFDPVEGMDFNTMLTLRSLYPKTAGNIAIGINDDQIQAMMTDPRIDYIIPYHISGLAKAERVESGIGEWQDYTKIQEEKGGKGPELMDWWDYTKSGDQNTPNYLEWVRSRGITPKFEKFIFTPSGREAYDAGKKLNSSHVKKGSWKLLIDRKMFDNDGNPIIQAPVQPEFDEALITSMMEGYKGKTVTANKEVVEAFTIGAATEKHSIRTKPAPKKTVKAYKLMRIDPRKPGQLFPLFVNANDNVPMGQWIDATAGETTTTKTGATKVKSKLGPLAYRPGWHLGDVPLATHIGKKEPGAPRNAPISYMDSRHVWVEAEVAADVDYQEEANNNGINPKTGKMNMAKADIKYLPEDGYYRYKTNPNMTGNWIITGSVKLNRVLTDSEAAEIVRKAGLEPLPRFGGEIDLRDYGFEPDGETKMSVRPVFEGKEYKDPADWTEDDQFTYDLLGFRPQTPEYTQHLNEVNQWQKEMEIARNAEKRANEQKFREEFNNWFVQSPTVADPETDFQGFDKTSTGMSYYDDFLDPKQAEYLAQWKGLVGYVAEMSPDEYLQRVSYQIFEKPMHVTMRGVEMDQAKKYAQMMKEGTKFKMPMLNYGEYSGQEGRHRAVAAKEAGIDKIPVLIVKNTEKYSTTVYHGTPYDIDRFDLDKIGSGEGAQAYGWGLYFAQSIDVAKDYRYTVTQRRKPTVINLIDAVTKETTDLESTVPENAKYVYEMVLNFYASQSGSEAYSGEIDLDELIDDIKYYTDVVADEYQMNADDTTFTGLAEGWTQDRVDAETMVLEMAVDEWIDKLNDSEWINFKAEDFKGRLYTVEVPDMDRMLDFDENFSKQSDHVQYRVQRFISNNLGNEDRTRQYRRYIQEQIRERYKDPANKGKEDVLTAEERRELDGMHRLEVLGEVAKQLDYWTKNPRMNGRMAYLELQHGKLGSDRETSQFFKEIGIPALNFWDGFSRSKAKQEDGTAKKNVVVFDDSLIDIIEKNSVRAWHGTPHDFDEFSITKIGTGEGAQAYGYGLYFADTKGTAEWYKEALSAPQTDFELPDGGSFEQWANQFGIGGQRVFDHLVWEDENTPITSVKEAVELAEDYVSELEEQISDGVINDPNFKAMVESARIVVDEMAAWDNDSFYAYESDQREGKLFKVDLALDDENLLLYDKDISDMDPKVQRALVEMASEFGISVHTYSTGADFYAKISRELGNDRLATQEMREYGIRGIKYENGVGTGFNYVVFNDQDISVLEKYSIAEPTVQVQMDPKDKEKGEGFIEMIKRRVIDRFRPVGKVSREAKVLAANAAIVSGTVEHVATEALVDTVGNVVDKSLAEVVEPIADNQDFWQYMAQLHNIDRAAEGKPVDPGMTPEDSQAYVNQKDLDNPTWRGYAKDVTGWIDSFMREWAVKPGIISEDVYNEWREMYPYYFPTQREFSDLEGGGNYGPGKRFVDLPSPVKRAKGSSRDISNPVGNIIQMINKVVRTERYNEVGQALVKSARDGSDLLEIVPTSEAMFSTNLDNVVQVWENGRPTYLRVNNQELLDSIKGLPRIINNAKAMRKITGFYKALITQDNPLFALRNIMRDVPTAYVYGQQWNPLTFGANLLKAGFQAATGTGAAARYKALGGGGSGQFHADEAAEYARLLQPSAASKLGAPIRAIRKLNEIMELAPRISEFDYVLKKTGDVHEALYAAQNVTVDFARGGDVTKMAEPFVPYLNASVQGIDRFFQAFNFKADPKGALARMAKAGVAITAPQLASYMMSMIEQPEEYEELSQRTKDSYYVFPKGDGTFHKIPKSRELSVVFGSLFERALTGDFEGFAGTVATNFSPVDPFTNNIFSPIMYNLPLNQDFAGRPIVPRNLENYSPRYQYDTNTSEIAKFIGDKANLSPEQIDYLIRSYSGVIGQLLIPATTKRAGAGTALERMTVGAFTADPAFSSETVTEFYDTLEAAERAKNDKNKAENLDPRERTMEERYYSGLSSIASLSSKATAYINQLQSDDPQIRDIKLTVQDHMRQAMEVDDVRELLIIERKMKTELSKLGVPMR